ncbi:hypothetical protein NM688_g4368 [Phlebia brevispora]|uniref:Uncharacterized protein n=1 Tax=Phlebia brevispora TaxID=194682 RepID=A0ACC1T2V0_9APHY|nr:hypothetical protein NM688_g4368 [Phlebia brevispora]
MERLLAHAQISPAFRHGLNKSFGPHKPRLPDMLYGTLEATSTPLPVELWDTIVEVFSLGSCHRTRRPKVHHDGHWRELCGIALVCTRWARKLERELSVTPIVLYTHQDAISISTILYARERYIIGHRIRGYPDIVEQLRTPYVHQVPLHMMPALELSAKDINFKMSNSGLLPQGQNVTSIHKSLPWSHPFFSTGIRRLRLDDMHFRSFRHLLRLIREMPSLTKVECWNVRWDMLSPGTGELPSPTFFLARDDTSQSVHFVTIRCTDDKAALWLSTCLGLTREDILDRRDANSLVAFASPWINVPRIAWRTTDSIFAPPMYASLTPRMGKNQQRRVKAIAFQVGKDGYDNWSLFDWPKIEVQLATLDTLQVVLVAFESYDLLYKYRSAVLSLMVELRNSRIQLKFAFDRSESRSLSPSWIQASLTEDNIQEIGEPVTGYRGWTVFLIPIFAVRPLEVYTASHAAFSSRAGVGAVSAFAPPSVDIQRDLIYSHFPMSQPSSSNHESKLYLHFYRTYNLVFLTQLSYHRRAACDLRFSPSCSRCAFLQIIMRMLEGISHEEWVQASWTKGVIEMIAKNVEDIDVIYTPHVGWKVQNSLIAERSLSPVIKEAHINSAATSPIKLSVVNLISDGLRLYCATVGLAETHEIKHSSDERESTGRVYETSRAISFTFDGGSEVGGELFEQRLPPTNRPTRPHPHIPVSVPGMIINTVVGLQLPIELYDTIIELFSLGSCHRTRLPKIHGHRCQSEQECTRKYVGCSRRELCQIALVCRRWARLLKAELSPIPPIVLNNRYDLITHSSILPSSEHNIIGSKVKGYPDITEQLQTPWIHGIPLRLLPAIRLSTSDVYLHLRNSSPFPPGQKVASIHRLLPRSLPCFSSGIRTLSLSSVHFRSFEHLLRFIKEMPSLKDVVFENVSWAVLSIRTSEIPAPASFLARDDPSQEVCFEMSTCTNDKGAFWLSTHLGLTREDILDQTDADSLVAMISPWMKMMRSSKRQKDSIDAHPLYVSLTPRTGRNQRRKVWSIAFAVGSDHERSQLDWAQICTHLAALTALEVILLAFHSYDLLRECCSTILPLTTFLSIFPHIKLKIAFRRDDLDDEWIEASLIEGGIKTIGKPFYGAQSWAQLLPESQPGSATGITIPYP